MTANCRKFFAITLLSLGLSACGERTETTERSGGGPEPVADAATQVGISTGGQVGMALNAPGNYVRGLAGDIEKAKAAAALAGKTAADRADMDPSKDAGN